MNLSSSSRLAVAAAIAFGAAVAHAADPRVEFLKESMWLLQSGSEQTYVWFEALPGGRLDLVKCPREPKCRLAVVFDDGGFHVGGSTGISFPLDLAARNVPIFASPGGTLLMPAWVVPTAQSRMGY